MKVVSSFFKGRSNAGGKGCRKQVAKSSMLLDLSRPLRHWVAGASHMPDILC